MFKYNPRKSAHPLQQWRREQKVNVELGSVLKSWQSKNSLYLGIRFLKNQPLQMHGTAYKERWLQSAPGAFQLWYRAHIQHCASYLNSLSYKIDLLNILVMKLSYSILLSTLLIGRDFFLKHKEQPAQEPACVTTQLPAPFPCVLSAILEAWVTILRMPLPLSGEGLTFGYRYKIQFAKPWSWPKMAELVMVWKC